MLDRLLHVAPGFKVPRLDRVQFGESRAIHVGPGEAAVIVEVRYCNPSFATVTQEARQVRIIPNRFFPQQFIQPDREPSNGRFGEPGGQPSRYRARVDPMDRFSFPFASPVCQRRNPAHT